MAGRARQDPREDPLAVRNQPALWTAARRRWLVPAGILGLVGVGMLAATLSLQILIPSAGIVLTIALYAIMLACAGMRDAHRRNVAFAWLMGGMAAVPTLALVLVTIGESRG